MAEHPNVEGLRRGYAAYSGGDMDIIDEVSADDIEWRVAGRSPISGDHHGKGEVPSTLATARSSSSGTRRSTSTPATSSGPESEGAEPTRAPAAGSCGGRG